MLGHIWNLSDVDDDGKLNQGEFVSAMHLIMGIRQGLKLPTTLPDFLHPSNSLPTDGSHRVVEQKPAANQPSDYISVDDITDVAHLQRILENSEIQEESLKKQVDAKTRVLDALEEQRATLRQTIEEKKSVLVNQISVLYAGNRYQLL